MRNSYSGVTPTLWWYSYKLTNDSTPLIEAPDVLSPGRAPNRTAENPSWPVPLMYRRTAPQQTPRYAQAALFSMSFDFFRSGRTDVIMLYPLL